MLDYGRGVGMTGGYGAGGDFAAMPKVISGKPKYKDPYGQTKIQENGYHNFHKLCLTLCLVITIRKT
jgi:hypothetical protein